MRVLYGLTALVLVAGIMTVPAVVSAQYCAVAAPTDCSGYFCQAAFRAVSGPSAMYAARFELLIANQANCVPTGTGSIPFGYTQMVSGSPTSLATAPVCSWTCGPYIVANIRFDSSDGLPVELMEFSVEEDENDETDEKAEAEEGP